MLGFHKQMDNRIKLLEEILSFRMQGVEFDNGDMYVDGHKAASDVRDEFVSVCNRYKLITNVRSSLMAVNIHITIIELNALHTKRQNLFQELDAVIHLLMEAKHWGLRKSRNATSLNSRFKSLDTLKVKIISVSFRRVIRTNHKKASKIWRHENIQLGGCQS